MALTYAIGGIAKCTAENEIGSDTQMAYVMVGELDRPFMMWQESPEILISDGDNFTLNCGAIAYNYTNRFLWFFENDNGDRTTIEDHNHSYSIEQMETTFSRISKLTVKSATKEDIGRYICRVQTDKGEYENLSHPITVHTPRAPYVIATNLTGKDIGVKLGNYVEILCNISGIPRPEISWYKDGDRLLSTNSLNITVTPFAIRVPGTPDHEGEYRCYARNKAGEISYSGKLVATSESIDLNHCLRLKILIYVTFM